jgi:hypothetical protein
MSLTLIGVNLGLKRFIQKVQTTHKSVKNVYKKWRGEGFFVTREKIDN